MKIDIAVVGGGSAGVAAAVTAARLGAEVLLIERYGMLGGTATTALVHSLCGLYQLRAHESEPLLPTNCGFPMEFANLLQKNGGTRGPVRMGKLDVLLHQPACFAYSCDELVQKESHLRTFFHTEVIAVEKSDSDRIASLRLHSHGNTMVLEPSVVIDTTGQAEIAHLAGAATVLHPLEKLQRPAYIFGVGGTHAETLTENRRIEIALAIAQAVKKGLLPAGALGVAFRAGVQAQEIWGTIDLQAPEFDPRNFLTYSALEIEGRHLAWKILHFLRKEIPSFENAFLSIFPTRAGIRESRRVIGRYELTETDLLAGTDFPDEIAKSSWPIELRETAKGAKFRFPETLQPASIPLRALQSKNLQNYFVAGKCISCTHEAQAGIRVIGTCLATGEAAGTAATKIIQES